jgi:O-antigen/teichoic acid export membrane protein
VLKLKQSQKALMSFKMSIPILVNSRSWMLLASLATRGAGFLISLLIARLAGASALGTYSTLVNTASAVATPFAGALGNNSTLFGAEDSRSGAANTRVHARASLLLALGLSTLSAAALILLYMFALAGDASQSLLLLAAGVSVVIGQMVGAVCLGFLYGAGKFKLASQVSVSVALAICLSAYPAIEHFGFHGAIALLLIASLFPPMIMVASLVATSSTMAGPSDVKAESIRKVAFRFVRAWPSIAAGVANNGVNWVCTIYLVHSVFGTPGVGVVAVATQWLNLMLLPATSWGGSSLKTLSDAIASGSEKTAWGTATGLIRNNLMVTLTLAGSIALASLPIADVYSLTNSDVALLICINAASATVAAITNVFERFLLALDRQAWWLIFSLVSLFVQTSVTFFFITYGMWVVALGAFVAGIVLCLLSYMGVSQAMQIRMKEWK